MKEVIYIGHDKDQREAFGVAVYSARRMMFRRNIPIVGLYLDGLISSGMYSRPTSERNGQLYDEISAHPMATEFACSRFLVPILARSGKALFMDCDVLVMDDLAKIFDETGDLPVYCVKHRRGSSGIGEKMNGKTQGAYERQNWSSVMLFNCDHPANSRLTLSDVNTRTGRELHGFYWLKDEEIGELHPRWNYLPGISPDLGTTPGICHFTEGGPWHPGYEGVEFADQWRAARSAMR